MNSLARALLDISCMFSSNNFNKKVYKQDT